MRIFFSFHTFILSFFITFFILCFYTIYRRCANRCFNRCTNCCSNRCHSVAHIDYFLIITDSYECHIRPVFRRTNRCRRRCIPDYLGRDYGRILECAAVRKFAQETRYCAFIPTPPLCNRRHRSRYLPATQGYGAVGGNLYTTPIDIRRTFKKPNERVELVECAFAEPLHGVEPCTRNRLKTFVCYHINDCVLEICATSDKRAARDITIVQIYENRKPKSSI